MNHLDPGILYLLIAIAAVSVFAILCRGVFLRCQLTREQRLKVEAERLMLRFCKNPTQANQDAAWDFIHANHIMFAELDWPLVQRFSRTSVISGLSNVHRQRA